MDFTPQNVEEKTTKTRCCKKYGIPIETNRSGLVMLVNAFLFLLLSCIMVFQALLTTIKLIQCVVDQAFQLNYGPWILKLFKYMQNSEGVYLLSLTALQKCLTWFYQ